MFVPMFICLGIIVLAMAGLVVGLARAGIVSLEAGRGADRDPGRLRVVSDTTLPGYGWGSTRLIDWYTGLQPGLNIDTLPCSPIGITSLT